MFIVVYKKGIHI